MRRDGQLLTKSADLTADQAFVDASSSASGRPPQGAFDGDPNTIWRPRSLSATWTAGLFAPTLVDKVTLLFPASDGAVDSYRIDALWEGRYLPLVREDFFENGDYVIYFADDGSPRLRISPNYQQMLSQPGTTKETRDFIKEKVRSAVDLLRNIEHRRQTIYRVVESIVNRQRDFLDHGVQGLKPMMLKDIAEDIGMHLSTVSRVVNRKYAHTPQGVIELRRFFTEGMMNEEGEEVSTRIIKLNIKKLIEEEDSHNPITDDQVVKILIKDGIKLSRRTVAKYRDQMNIPGSRERRAVV